MARHLKEIVIAFNSNTFYSQDVEREKNENIILCIGIDFYSSSITILSTEHASHYK